MRGLAGLLLPRPAGGLLPVYGIADVVAFILNSPVAADVPVHVRGIHLSCFPAGKDEGVFLADTVAGNLEDLTADECGLGGMREIDAVSR